ncbi:MAG: serine protease [Bacteroidales bacterium]|nr:serine protease [Bacteroidales bacterium]
MKKVPVYFLILLLTVSAGCRNKREVAASGYEEREQLIEQEIRRVSEKTHRTYCVTHYDTYYFETEDGIRNSDLDAVLFDTLQADPSTESSMGTATLLHSNHGKMVFLTCNHIFDYPDTLKQHFYRSDGTETPFIASVSFKTSQKQFVRKGTQTIDLDFIARDSDLDIAFLMAKGPDNLLPPSFEKPVTGSRIAAGKTAYISGYPSGYQMITKATVSKPIADESGRVFLDANFNKGYSGAPFFVFSNANKRLELAGIVTSAASERKNIIVPEYPSHMRHYHSDTPYQGPLYVATDERIKYGITFTIVIEKINDFYTHQRSLFKDKGVSLDSSF